MDKTEIIGTKTLTRVLIAVGVIFLLAVGSAAGQLVEGLFEKQTVTTAYISGKLEDMGELTTQKLTYSGIFEVKEGAIPFITEKGFMMSYNAEVEARIDFEQVDIKITKDKVSIKIPHATVQRPEIVEDSIKFLSEKKAIFNWSEKEDITKAISDAETRDNDKMDFSQLLKQADEHAELLLYKMFDGSVGKRDVEISFK